MLVVNWNIYVMETNNNAFYIGYTKYLEQTLISFEQLIEIEVPNAVIRPPKLIKENGFKRIFLLDAVPPDVNPYDLAIELEQILRQKYPGRFIQSSAYNSNRNKSPAVTNYKPGIDKFKKPIRMT